MRFFRITTAVICFQSLLAPPATATPLAKRVDHAMTNEIAKQELIGLAVGIIQDGQITYLKGYGLADRELRLPVTRQTMFRWASISKSLTAVAAMQLWERGELDLEREVYQYVPEFPNKGVMLRVRHLLCHQSGIVHYTNGKVIRTRREYPVSNPYENVIFALDTFKESPLVNEPGEKYSYTTHGYILLSAVVERAHKQKFALQVRDRIAKPLELGALKPDYQWKEIPHRAVGYRRHNGEVKVSTDTDVSWKLGGGGFISNIDDLAKFAAGLLNHQLVKAATRRKMWTRQMTRDGKQTKYALGFSFNHYRNGELHTWKADGTGIEIVGHSGSQEKTKTWMALWPEKKLGVVLMSNSKYANPRRLAGRLLEAVMQQDSKQSDE